MKLIERIQPVLILVLTVVVAILLFKNYIQQDKIVYINTPRLLSQYVGMKEVNEEIKKKSGTYKANLDTVYNEFQASMKEYEKKRSKMSVKEQKLSEELLMNKKQQLMGYQEATQKKAAEEEGKLREQVVQKANTQIHEYAKKKGYMYVLGATAMGNVVYGEKRNDVTDEMLNYLNEQYKK